MLAPSTLVGHAVRAVAAARVAVSPAAGACVRLACLAHRSEMLALAQASGVPLAITYRRVSSDDQADTGVSRSAQRSETAAYLAAHGWIFDSDHFDILTGKCVGRRKRTAISEETENKQSPLYRACQSVSRRAGAGQVATCACQLRCVLCTRTGPRSCGFREEFEHAAR